jgi:hypothetical protein
MVNLCRKYKSLFKYVSNKSKLHADFISPQLEWPYLRIINVGEDVAKQEPYTLFVGMQVSTTTMESSMEIPQKAKNRTAI